ncbi:FAD-binding protein, partial [Aquitalea magnusonii]|uniref:FAD-binding protein n=1 Tax=Aquitalea magnusonii TaxID=332411 RepID=UPI000A9BC074
LRPLCGPGLPTLASQLPALQHLADKCGIDPTRDPLLVYPTLHYQNGGVVIDSQGQSSVPGLLCAGEITGGIHGLNGLGERFVDELARVMWSRRHAARMCRRRGIERDGQLGLFLDLRPLCGPGLPTLASQLPALQHLADKCGIDPTR